MKITGINFYSYRKNQILSNINPVSSPFALLKQDCVSFSQNIETKDWWEILNSMEFYLTLNSFKDDKKRTEWLKKKDWGGDGVMECADAEKLQYIFNSLGDNKDFWFNELYRKTKSGSMLLHSANAAQTNVILKSFGPDDEKRLEYIEQQDFCKRTALFFADEQKAFYLLDAFKDDNDRRSRFINFNSEYFNGETALFTVNADTAKVILDSLGGACELKIKAITARNRFLETPLFGADSKKAYYFFEVFGHGFTKNLEEKVKYFTIQSKNGNTAQISDIAPMADDSPLNIIDECYSMHGEILSNGINAPADYEEKLQKNNINAFQTSKNETLEDFARKIEFNVDSPKGFDDIVGLKGFKKEVMQRVIEPSKNPQQQEVDFREYGKKPCTTILLYGPSGCGKTYFIQALAREANLPLYRTGPEIIGSQYINASAKNVNTLFELLYKEADRKKTPVILFVDEIDTMTRSRNKSHESPEDNKQVTTFLNAMDEARKHNIIIAGATNLYKSLDKSVQSRFQIKEEILPPSSKAINEYIKRILSKTEKGQALKENEEEIEKISKLLKGYSYRSINEIYQQALLGALNDDRREICRKDFEKAIKSTSETKINLKDKKENSKSHKKTNRI